MSIGRQASVAAERRVGDDSGLDSRAITPLSETVKAASPVFRK
jgi:hypothetical protein